MVRRSAHSQLIHGDIAARNVLIVGPIAKVLGLLYLFLSAKLADIGFAVHTDDEYKARALPELAWKAPEIMRGGRPTTEV